MPNPIDPTNPIYPLDTDPASQGAAELRALKAYIVGLLPGGFTNQNLFRKNLIINGGCKIDQQNAGVAITPPTKQSVPTFGTFVADMWEVWRGTGVTCTAQRTATQVMGAGTTHRVELQTTVGAAPVAADIAGFEIGIEASDLAYLQWGTVNALPISVSFIAQSPVAGKHCVALRNSSSITGTANRTYLATFNINAPNVPQAITINDIPGDTAGVWNSVQGQLGLDSFFDAGCGSNFESATENAWQAGNFLRSPTCAKPQSVAGTFAITNFQIEQAIGASIFEQRPVAEILFNCMRFYEKTFLLNSQVKQNIGTIVNTLRTVQVGTTIIIPWHFKVAKPFAPQNVNTYNPSAANAQARDITVGADCSVTGWDATTSGADRFVFTATPAGGAASGDVICLHADARSSLY